MRRGSLHNTHQLRAGAVRKVRFSELWVRNAKVMARIKIRMKGRCTVKARNKGWTGGGTKKKKKVMHVGKGHSPH